MDKNEKKMIPDISFKSDKTPVTEDVLSEFEGTDEPLINDNEPSDENAKERISKHVESLNKALSEFDKENEDDKKKSADKAKMAALSVNGKADRPMQGKKKKNKGKKRKKKKARFNFSIIGGLTITIMIVSISIVLSLGAINYGMEYLGINKSDNEITFNIPEGSSNDDIADILIENKIIKSKNLFKLALRISDTSTLFPGDISLSPNTSYPDIIDKLSVMRESYETVEIVVPEGATLYQVSKWLEKNGVCSASDFLFQFNVSEDDFAIDSRIEHDPDVYYTMEGYFFPDTYEFYVGDSAYNISKKARDNFASKITDDMYRRMDQLGMDLNEVITLASIVQTEAGSVEDMPTVASVFINRLNDPDTFPNLQSDATKSYVKKVIKKTETSTTLLDHYTNCYDTYTCLGLPAGPVCNPGLDAINAVLYPEETEYYYFCNNLETGESFFAETYKQHKKNLKKAGLSE